MLPKFIPVFPHKLTNYNSFIKTLNQEKIDVLAQNKEKYNSFSKNIFVEKGGEGENYVYIKLRFVDSSRFLPSSLDKLSQTLVSAQK